MNTTPMKNQDHYSIGRWVLQLKDACHPAKIAFIIYMDTIPRLSIPVSLICFYFQFQGNIGAMIANRLLLKSLPSWFLSFLLLVWLISYIGSAF